MKKVLFLFPLFILILTLIYPSNLIGNGGGSPGGKTGSPLDNSQTCQGCHYAGIGTGATITTNIPASGYTLGNIYTINISITQSGISKFGFEITSEENNFGSAKAGTFLITDAVETKYTNNNFAVTHKAAGTGTSTNTKSWSMDWAAPPFSNSSGGVVFYASFMGANGDGTNMGDTYHSATLSVSESNTTSLIENESNKISNIRDNRIYFKEDIENCFVYNLSGKLVLTISEIEKQKVVDLSGLKKQLYIIKVIDKQGKSFSEKIQL